MLIDSHCHLPHHKYAKPLKQVIEDAMAIGVTRLINIGTSVKENLQTIEVSHLYDNVYSALAIYPHEDKDKDLATLRAELENQLGKSEKIIALGECGLDITDWHGGRNIADQIALFEMQLDLALKLDLPVIIHNRGGDDLVFDILKPFVEQGLTGVAHCFSSSQLVAKKYLDSGFYLSFSAMITYKGRDALRKVAVWAPQDRILIETDSPYLPPQNMRGQTNEPKNVVEVAKKLAEVRSVPFETIADVTYRNTCRLFGLP